MGSPDIQGQSFVEYHICTGLMNGETKPIKGFSVLNFPTDLLVTLLSNGEVVTQSIPDFLHNKLSIANVYIDQDKPLEEQTENLDSVSLLLIRHTKKSKNIFTCQFQLYRLSTNIYVKKYC